MNLALASVLLLLASPAGAANTVLSGEFDGSEPTTAGLPGTCDDAGELAYREIGPVRVSESGTYTVSDAFNINGVDVSANIYQGSFDPANPLAGLLTPDGVDVADDVTLNAGTRYVLVVQRWCLNPNVISHTRNGAWAVTFTGPGSVTSDHRVSVPAWTEGAIDGADPAASTDCSPGPYREIGPVQVVRSGTYYYSDWSWRSDLASNIDICMQVYSAPFDSSNTNAGRVATSQQLDDFGTVELTANTDYYFVVQPTAPGNAGDFLFVLAAPALRISFGMAGNWFDPPTSGQGFFMDVYDNINQMFVGWYTYDLERPPEDATALMGDPGHRWLTAQGPFSGDTATLDIYWTTGMIFDSPEPPRNLPVKDGKLTITFEDCKSGVVDYVIPSVAVAGQVPIQRVANDAVQLCENYSEGPAQPGPL
jgi:hypothetical protein